MKTKKGSYRYCIKQIEKDNRLFFRKARVYLESNYDFQPIGEKCYITGWIPLKEAKTVYYSLNFNMVSDFYKDVFDEAYDMGFLDGRKEQAKIALNQIHTLVEKYNLEGIVEK